jgi:phosphoglycerate dehydrogenase-like enzyme
MSGPGSKPASQPTRVLISDVGAARFGERIRAAAPGVVLVPVAEHGPLPDPGGAEVAFVTRDLFVGGTRFRQNPRYLRFIEYLKTAPALRWVQTFSAGTDMQVYQDMLARGLMVSNAAGASASAVAATAITGLMALARQLPRIAQQQREKRWESLYVGEEPRDVAGQHALVLGTGPIGQEIGRLAQAFGLRTTGMRRDPGAGTPPGFDAVAGFEALHVLLPTTHWLVLACPMTETTRGLIDATAFALLPEKAHLVNVSRGGIVQEEPLLAALRSGRLSGAFLDVFAFEPLAPESPFWELPNVIVSPHSAAASDGLPERVAAIFCRSLARFVAGEAPLNLAAQP